MNYYLVIPARYSSKKFKRSNKENQKLNFLKYINNHVFKK